MQNEEIVINPKKIDEETRKKIKSGSFVRILYGYDFNFYSFSCSMLVTSCDDYQIKAKCINYDEDKPEEKKPLPFTENEEVTFGYDHVFDVSPSGRYQY